MEIEKQIESCPISMPEYPLITLAHGGGGLLSQKLFEQVFLPAFENEYLREAHDGGGLYPSIFFDGVKIASPTKNCYDYTTTGMDCHEGFPSSFLRVGIIPRTWHRAA